MNLINYKIQNQHTKICSGPGILYSRLNLCLECQLPQITVLVPVLATGFQTNPPIIKLKKQQKITQLRELLH